MRIYRKASYFLLTRLLVSSHSLPFLFRWQIHLYTWEFEFSKLLSANFLFLIAQTELNLKRWMPLPLNAAGCINSVQMNILPKFTYLFQFIPIFIPKSFLNRFDNIMSSFIWNNKLARITKNILQHPKCLGGMAAPNFLAYYWASNSVQLCTGLDSCHVDPPLYLP